MSNRKLFLGLIIGAAAGAVATYLSDRKRREEFLDGVSALSGKAQDSLVGAYYKAKGQYKENRSKSSNATEEIVEELEDIKDKSFE